MSDRSPYDFYPTPSWCYENLNIPWELFETALEPCRGDGRIQSFLESEFIETEWCEIQEGRDFLSGDINRHFDLILTNPPFSLAQEFIEKSLPLADTVIMLLRLNFLGSQKRKDFWVGNEPTSLYILSKRPSFTGKGTDSTEYAWFVWDKTDKLPKGVFHI